MVKAEAVITGLRSPFLSIDSSMGGSSAGGTTDVKFCCATSRALVRVAIESDIRRLFSGRTGGLEFENVCDRRSNAFGRRGYHQLIIQIKYLNILRWFFLKEI